MVRVFVFISKVKESNLVNDVVCGQQWYVDKIFSYLILKICASIDYVAYLHRSGF
jgi:hypothetical protein